MKIFLFTIILIMLPVSAYAQMGNNDAQFEEFCERKGGNFNNSAYYICNMYNYETLFRTLQDLVRDYTSIQSETNSLKQAFSVFDTQNIANAFNKTNSNINATHTKLDTLENRVIKLENKVPSSAPNSSNPYMAFHINSPTSITCSGNANEVTHVPQSDIFTYKINDKNAHNLEIINSNDANVKGLLSMHLTSLYFQGIDYTLLGYIDDIPDFVCTDMDDIHKPIPFKITGTCNVPDNYFTFETINGDPLSILGTMNTACFN